ncbi:alpha/beta fold hydrolase [Achromobacter sp. GG226]|uniref:alpha/beta fold hydrolase n=1 Tax=Verticiella alkaliphila TaxID=2779529 RepID=UPI001C0B8F5B|nr:alpha/beta hydrolase [Verticiella sp. GG226]MBU4609449.1 alpha/beta fold hydrolase [Verticiella sp. GG226]
MKIDVGQTEQVTLNYDVQGEGPDVVMVHGLGLSSMKTWRFQVPELAKKYRVHTYDVRGFGQSSNPSGRFSVSQHAYDLHGLLQTLGLKQVILIGFSMGGWISQQFVLRHPEMVKGLVLACTTSGLRPEGAARFIARAERMEREGTAATVDEQIRNTFTADTLANDPELIAFYRREFLDEKENNSRHYAAMFRALTETNFTPQLGRITCPTLITCGDQDNGITRGNTPTDAAEILHQGIQGSEFQPIRGGGHYPHLEQPEQWNALVGGFLGRIA